ncbi:MAG: transposase [Chloroflexi bacterium]|nr:transposase [Chloroflexota bacterium]
MTRTGRPILPEATYFITCVSDERRKWFVNPRLAQIVVDQWKHYARAYEFTMDAYCVMLDHYHVVLNVGKKKTISQILHAVDSYTATLINETLGNKTKVKIWQGNPWDEMIRNEKMYWQKVAYTLLNPWREGLVKEPIDPYPFSDIDEWRVKMGEEELAELVGKYKRSSE